MKNAVIASLLLTGASAFPFVAEQDGVDSSLFRNARRLRARQQNGEGAGSAAQCPFNPNHVPAAPVTAPYLYNNAKNGIQGNGKGGYLVPDPNDKAHQYIAPKSTDIRGPCPGLNAAANHGFLARDGITTYTELVDAQQNVYNVGYDLANLLAALGLTLTDGDLVTEKLSIGCDATTRTSFNPALTGSEPGLDGHNKFEADSSLTRNDFFTHGGDDFTFNGTLFDMMTKTCNGNYNRENLSKYRLQRYSFVGEKIPANWTNRVEPYTNMLVTEEILHMYLENPVLFGGNTASGSFDTINFGAIQNGTISSSINAADTSCLLYQLATQSVPSYLNGVITPSVDALSFIASKVSPSFANLGCPQPLTK